MKRLFLFANCLLVPFVASAAVGTPFETDIIETSAGTLKITFVGHGSLMMTHGDNVIHIDPVAAEGDYTAMSKATLILVTHEHGDHLDPAVIKLLRTTNTAVVVSRSCAGAITNATVMNNGDVKTLCGITIQAVPAYNIKHMRSPGQPFHPKGNGNGYILTFGNTRVYIAGDTENTPEMKALKDIAVAFLPMNLPYTMTPAMVADAVKAFRPRILYPYHYGATDTSTLVKLLQDEPGIEVRIRNLR